jgi:iron complex transport system permease protein
MAHSALQTTKTFGLLIALSALALAASLWGLVAGEIPVTASEMLHALFAPAGDANWTHGVVWELRVPRVSGALAIGASLAVAGTLLQILLRNPLADPYVLGTAGGAAVGALSAILLGLATWATHLAALAGATLSTALVLALALRGGTLTSLRLILTGVVLGSAWNASISFLLVSASLQDMSSMLFWLLGDLGRVTSTLPAWLALAVGMVTGLACAPSLNALRGGELPARALGVRLERLRLVLLAVASLLTAVAVTLAGAVGFIGLVVPHLLRLAGVHDHRTLLPAAALLGGSTLVAADTLARTVIAPQQLPVGILTAALGVPVFLLLLWRSGRT